MQVLCLKIKISTCIVIVMNPLKQDHNGMLNNTLERHVAYFFSALSRKLLESYTPFLAL